MAVQKEDAMPEKRGAPRNPADIKRQLQIIERELNSLNKAQWSYAKNMLKFGLACWILGISAFFLAIMMTDAELFGVAQPVWASLLIIALAAPVTVTAVFVRRVAIKIKRLERIRRGLLAEYFSTLHSRFSGRLRRES